MRHLYMMACLAFFTMPVVLLSAQDGDRETVKKRAVKIASAYEDSVVHIENTLSAEGGQKIVEFGSGFFINDKGYIFTCCHVVKEENDEFQIFFGPKLKINSYAYSVILPNKNQKFKAELIGWDRYTDTALLRIDIDPKDCKPAKLGSASKLKKGDTVFAIGSPYGLQGSITNGIVSALHRHFSTEYKYIEDFIQTSAAINPGNSGGPLINEMGEVVGINAAIIGGGDNLGFAVPIDLANITRLMKGEAKVGYTGIEVLLDNFPRSNDFSDMEQLNELTKITNIKALMSLMDLTKKNYSLITAVNENSPAMDSKFQRGDLITSFAGKQVTNGRDVRLVMLELEIGKEVEVKVTRFEKAVAREISLTLKIAEGKGGK